MSCPLSDGRDKTCIKQTKGLSHANQPLYSSSSYKYKYINIFFYFNPLLLISFNVSKGMAWVSWKLGFQIKRDISVCSCNTSYKCFVVGPTFFSLCFFWCYYFILFFFLSFLASILPFDSPFILNHISNLDEVIQQESSTWAMAKEVLAVCLIFFFMGFLVLVNLAKKTYLNINWSMLFTSVQFGVWLEKFWEFLYGENLKVFKQY